MKRMSEQRKQRRSIQLVWENEISQRGSRRKEHSFALNAAQIMDKVKTYN